MTLTFAVAVVSPAGAYIGPGAGVGLIGTTIVVAISILVALWVVVSWPIMHLLRKSRAGAAQDKASAEEMAPAADSGEQATSE